ALFARDASFGLPDRGAVEGEFRLLEEICGRRGSLAPRVIKRELQELMWTHMGIVRDGGLLREGLRKLENLKDRLPDMGGTGSSRRYNFALLEAVELPRMLSLAEI